MKRVLLAAATVEPGRGGIARVARMSGRALAEAGCSVTCVSYLDRSEPELGIERLHVAMGSKLRFLALCQISSMRADFSVYDSIGIARARPRLPGLRRPYAVWMHGIEAWESLSPSGADALRDAALVLVNSRYTLRRFEALHGTLHSARVCQLATEEDSPGETPASAAPPSALILSRIETSESYKGHAALIAAWPRVVAQIAEARLLIAGGGSGLAAVKEAAAHSPVADNIEVLGFVPEDKMPELWARSNLFAMPSRGEGFGLVYIEAMRQGLPVIASIHDAGQEVNIDGETGFNVAQDDPDVLSQRIVALLSENGAGGRMGLSGQRRWQTHFRYSAFRERFLECLAPFVGS